LQGYFLSPPMGADRLNDFIMQRNRAHPASALDEARAGP
jgi:hypothetical protein